jgi:RNA-binding protein
MRRAGEVVRAAQGLAILRVAAEDAPDPERVDRDHPDLGAVPGIGTGVVDSSLTEVGSVVDVFGPVGRPYLAVKPGHRDPASLLGERLYVDD